MSHAAVLVVVSPDEIEEHGGIEEAVRHNMVPFNETGEALRDGSRWDEWTIGGRFGGLLLGKDTRSLGELRLRLDELVADEGQFPAHRAFLRRRNWHERKRLGWFGAAAQTECEARGKEVRRCKVRDSVTEAIVVSWNEPREVWQPAFWRRFLAPCPNDELAVVVDYHV